jgi:hypothetical protein
MYRIGQGNGFTYIGMPTIVTDTACKLRVKTNNNGIEQVETRKRPSAGLDMCREAGDFRRTSHEAYIEGYTPTQDDQKVPPVPLNPSIRAIYLEACRQQL